MVCGVQVLLELVVEQLGSFLRAMPWVEGIVLSGGCALNVKVNAAVGRAFNLPVYIPAAPNDGGLTVGGVWLVQPPLPALLRIPEAPGAATAAGDVIALGSPTRASLGGAAGPELLFAGFAAWDLDLVPVVARELEWRGVVRCRTFADDIDMPAVLAASDAGGDTGTWQECVRHVAMLLADGQVVAVLRGRQELGPVLCAPAVFVQQ